MLYSLAFNHDIMLSEFYHTIGKAGQTNRAADVTLIVQVIRKERANINTINYY